MKKYWLGILAALGLSTAVAGSLTPPDVVVKGTTAELQALIAQNHVKYKADLAAFYKVVNDVVVPHFDVRYIARSILARNWKGASEEQRTRFAEAFKGMLIRSYANALLEYHDSVKAEWKPLRAAEGAEDVVVLSSLLREGKPPVSVAFSMHLADGEWRIYDISVENISLITNFRGQFNSEIKRSSLDTVIQRMETGDYQVSARGASTTAADTKSGATP